MKLVGEASKKLSKNFRESYYEIPWKEIAGMRDKLIHDYMGIDTDVIWKTINTDIPQLESMIRKIEL